MKASWKPFVAGLAVGILLTSAFFAFGVRRFRRGMREGAPFAHMLKVLNRKLELSAEQSVKVEAVLQDKRRKLEAMREEAKPRFDALREEGRAEIRAVLTPVQQSKFDALEEQWKKRRPGPPAPPPPGP